MLNALISFSLKNRFLVLLAAALLIVVGVQAALRLPLDAFPDTTPVQVQINTVASELSPEEVERLITFPVEYAIGGLKGLQEVRSVSKFGFSQVVAIFEDATDVYFARQQINERLGEVELPQGIARPVMGPVATGLGEVYHYILHSENPQYDLTELRALQDWVIRPRLRRVAGVAEVNVWGGLAKQFEVRSDPVKLAKYGFTFNQLMEALRRNNQNVGGGTIARAGEASLIQGVGRTTTAEQISNVVIQSLDGVPIRVKDVAEVEIGHAIRRGAVTAEGKGEAVLGLAFMRMGENSPRGDPRPGPGDGVGPQGLATWGQDRCRLSSHRPRQSRPEDCRAQFIRGRHSRHRGALRLPRELAGRVDCRVRHPALDAVCRHDDAEGGNCREPDEPRCHRFRAHRR